MLAAGRNPGPADAVAGDAALEVEVGAALCASERRQSEGEQDQEDERPRHPWWHESREISWRPPSEISTRKKTPARIPVSPRNVTAPRSSPRRSAQRRLRSAAPEEAS